MGQRLQDKVALVTAAGQGIGRACALRFASEGARVVVNDIRGDAAASVAAEITAAGGRATSVTADGTDAAQVNAMVADTAKTHGGLHILMNNVAAPLVATIDKITDETWRTVLTATLDSALFSMRAAIPIMAEQGGGSIINTASAAGMGGVPALGAYGAAKAALINLTKTVAVENARNGIRANAICPGSILTPPFLEFAKMVGGTKYFDKQIPMGRCGEPEEIAQVALFLASDESSYVTGSVVAADGGVLGTLGPPPQD